MRAIKFNHDITLAFIQANNTDIGRVSFRAGEFAEFTVQEDPDGSFRLTSAGGSYAPWVSREDFYILPEGFHLYRFTRGVRLSFGRYENGQRILDVLSKPYPKDSVHAFKITHDFPYDFGDNYFHLQTQNGLIIPDVHKSLIKRIGSSAPLALPSTNKTGKTEPKQVLEAFPAPVPGTQFGNSWELPGFFNSLRVVRDEECRCVVMDCPDTPFAYLRLVEEGGSLYYKASFFGVPRRKLTSKVG